MDRFRMALAALPLRPSLLPLSLASLSAMACQAGMIEVGADSLDAGAHAASDGASGGSDAAAENVGDVVLADVPRLSGPDLTAEPTTQIVYVNFDGPLIRDCVSCSNAPTNESFAIGKHFGFAEVDFLPYTNASGQATIVASLENTFAPYDVSITTKRPATGDYTMLVVSLTEGNHHGVAPLNCQNSNPNDIAFVYSIGDNSVSFMARAAAHELGHSFGLSHVVSTSDFMEWASKGSAFTVSQYDWSHESGKCFEGETQDAPGMLLETLGPTP